MEGVCPVRTKGLFKLRTFALFGAKTSNFSKFLICPQEQEGRGVFFDVSAGTRRERGFEQVRIFCKLGGGGSIFTILCGRLLWTTPICPASCFVFAKTKPLVEKLKRIINLKACLELYLWHYRHTYGQ